MSATTCEGTLLYVLIQFPGLTIVISLNNTKPVKPTDKGGIIMNLENYSSTSHSFGVLVV